MVHFEMWRRIIVTNPQNIKDIFLLDYYDRKVLLLPALRYTQSSNIAVDKNELGT